MNPAESLIIDAMQARVLLYADGDRLRYRAMRSMPPYLARQLKTHKDEVLDLLRPPEIATPADPATAFDNSVAPDRPRDQAARLLRQVRCSDPTCAAALRDAWHERVAICTVEAGLTDAETEKIAADDLAYALPMGKA